MERSFLATFSNSDDGMALTLLSELTVAGRCSSQPSERGSSSPVSIVHSPDELRKRENKKCNLH